MTSGNESFINKGNGLQTKCFYVFLSFNKRKYISINKCYHWKNNKLYAILLTIEISKSSNFSDFWELLETQQIICLLNDRLFLKHRNQ